MPAGSAGGRNVKDMTGQQCGSLKVIRRSTGDLTVGGNSRKRKLAKWICVCACGKTAVAVGTDLRNGKTKTCGCRTSIKSRRNFQGYKGIGKALWRNAIQNAEQRGYEFSVSIEYMWCRFALQQGRCAMSGMNLELSHHKRTASIDRIDNDIGYIEGNVQWVHKDINKLKGVMSVDKLIMLCRTVATFQGNLVNPDAATVALREVQAVLERNARLLR